MEQRLTNDRKKNQRKLNKAFRMANKIIEEDDLWRGRFIVRQKETYWMNWHNPCFPSEDFLGVGYYYYDKKTGRKSEVRWEYAFHFYDTVGVGHLLWEITHFIVDECKVWENEKPYEDKTDYRKVGM